MSRGPDFDFRGTRTRSLNIRSVQFDEDADELGVRRFKQAMLEKLARKRREGRSGWHLTEECPIRLLRAMLKEHVKKGDMVDVGNIAMMIWNRQHPTGKPRSAT